MNCHEFQEILNSQDALTLTPECDSHARGCPACRKKMEVNQRLVDGIAVLRATCRPPDLTGAIRGKIATAAPSGAPQPAPWGKSLLAWWQGLLAPTTPLRAGVSFGLAVVLVIVISLPFTNLINRGTGKPSGKTPVAAGPWQVSFRAGEVPANLEKLFPAGSGYVPVGTMIETGPAGEVRLKLAGRCEMEARGASLELKPDGFRLMHGKVGVKVTPSSDHSVPFQARTPFALVTVLGTEYALDLTATALTASVKTGRVRVETPRGQTRVLTFGEQVVVDRAGWVTVPQTQPASLPPGSDRPEVPED